VESTVEARLSEVSMTIHQCPKCELKFAIKTVLDWHLRNDHPNFHHDYPVRGEHHWDVESEPQKAPSANGSPAS
jgi:hypothetical protein